MNQEEFIELVVKEQIRDRSFSDCREQLMDGHVGKGVYPECVAASVEAYKEFSKEDRAKIDQYLKLAIHAVVFKFLVVLDGVNNFDEEDGKLYLEYRSKDNTRREVLASESEAEEFLYTLYNSDFPDWFNQ